MGFCPNLLLILVLSMFDFSNYYDTGDYLAKMPNESNIRSGISRYYYAGFCSVRNYLVEIMDETEFVGGYNIHKRICNRLIQSQNDTEASIGEKLNFLKELRNEADYDWRLDFDYFNNRLIVVQKDSKMILEQVDALKASPPFEL